MGSTFSFREENMEVRGSKVRLLRAGKGEPLLWLHGANGAGWGTTLETLSTSFDVIVPDHPGFGQSELPEWISTIDDLAFHYRDFLDVLGLEKVNICGSSLGGWIGLQFALTQTHRVKKLVVSNAAGINIPGKDSPISFRLSIPQLVERCFYDKTLAPKLPPVDELPVEMFRNRAMFAKLTWEKGYDPQLLHRLQGLLTPTLIVWGRNDELIPVEHAQRFQQAIPRSTLNIIENCGHLPYIEKAGEFTDKVFTFLT